MEFMNNFEEAEKIDKLRTKMMRYIMYKKRTEKEVRQKFQDEDANYVDDAIEYFKELHYIDDLSYIERSVQEFENLKNMSIREINYKLYQKGVDKKLIDDYFYSHREELEEYEIRSAQNIWNKKITSQEPEEIEQFLYKKGYMQETVKALRKDK